jgi:hypothetical protein
MKHLKRFRLFENKGIQDLDIEVTDAAPNGGDGGVQLDSLTLSVNGEEYYFELATTISNDSYITYKGGFVGGEGDFETHFSLVEDKRMKSEFDNPKPNSSYLELKDFISQLAYDQITIGDTTEIDGFEIEVVEYNHEGGYEFGYLNVLIGGDEITLNMKQDATGPGLDSEVTYDSDEDERIGKKHGLDLSSEDAQSFFFSEYDRICNEGRY